jgi:hypothetical protein
VFWQWENYKDSIHKPEQAQAQVEAKVRHDKRKEQYERVMKSREG